MNLTKVQLRLPEDLKQAAIKQAKESGVSLNLYLATAIAARVGARAETGRYFAARGARTTVARAKAILARAGTPGQSRPDDALDATDDDPLLRR